LTIELRTRWEKWIGDFVNLEKVKIARCFKPHDFGEPTTVELHHSDASTYGYGRRKGEYLANITAKRRWHTPRRNMQVGDIVIVKKTRNFPAMSGNSQRF
jgi:hypothetical protein